MLSKIDSHKNNLQSTKARSEMNGDIYPPTGPEGPAVIEGQGHKSLKYG
jgi:hypothetical protein